jgi:hypothetical protein
MSPYEDPFPPEPARAQAEIERLPSGSDEAPPTGFEGLRGYYRLIFKGMAVPGLPDPIVIGNAVIAQTEGPIRTQRTHIRQLPGWRPTFVKEMEHGVEVGRGHSLTVCQLDVVLSPGLGRAMRLWRDQALGAISLLVALFDERLAQEELAEDLLVLDGGEVIGAIDHVRELRTFRAINRVLDIHRDLIAGLAGTDLGADDPKLAAGRWYLRAAQLGPTPDAIVFLWVALEALSRAGAAGLVGAERPRTDVAWVERALREAGLDPAEVEPSVGRLAGLRADVVHHGMEQPDLLREGYYALEQLARLLLRHAMGAGPYGWPLSPDRSNVVAYLQPLADRLHARTRTVWR